MKDKRGFTLIELLVVIAVVGLLSSIILASLTSARNKSINSTIINNMQSVRSTAELYYDNHNNSYGLPVPVNGSGVDGSPCGLNLLSGTLFSDPKVIEAVNASLALTQGAVPLNQAICGIGPNGQTWSLSVPLRPNGFWCVASVGIALRGITADETSGGNGPEPECLSS